MVIEHPNVLHLTFFEHTVKQGTMVYVIKKEVCLSFPENTLSCYLWCLFLSEVHYLVNVPEMSYIYYSGTTYLKIKTPSVLDFSYKIQPFYFHSYSYVSKHMPCENTSHVLHILMNLWQQSFSRPIVRFGWIGWSSMILGYLWFIFNWNPL